LRSARRLQDLSKVAVAERRKFVEHDTEQRPVRLPPVLIAFVSLADNELQILKKHLAECPHRLGIFVHIERYKENQFLFDDIVDRKQMLIRTGDDRKLIVKERRALIEEALDLGHAVPVLQRLQEIFDRHFKVESPLRADPG